MNLRRSIIEAVLNIADDASASHSLHDLMEAAGLPVLDTDVSMLLDELELVAEERHAEEFSVVGMNFLPRFDICDIDVFDEDRFEVFIPVLGVSPDSVILTTDPVKVEVEERLGDIFLTALSRIDDDWLLEFFDETALLHPVYVKVTDLVERMLQLMWENSVVMQPALESNGLQTRIEVMRYFDLAVYPKLVKILEPFSG